MTKIKTGFISIFTLIWSYLGIVAVPWLALLFLNIIDYITGIMAAPSRNPDDERPVKSYLSLKGIQKKIMLHLLVIVGLIIDEVIRRTVGTAMPIKYPPIFGIAIALWLTFNEVISILENMEDAEVSIPPFLHPIMSMMKKEIEEKAAPEEVKERKQHDNNDRISKN